MKKITNMFLLVLVLAVVSHAGVVVSQNFDSATLGAKLGDLGWTGLYGVDASDWTVITGNDGSNATSAAGLADHQLCYDFTPALTASDQNIYVKATLTPMLAGEISHRVLAGTRLGSTAGGYIGTMFGLYEVAGTTDFSWYVRNSGWTVFTSPSSAKPILADHMYDMGLQIDQFANTGTLYSRDLTAGETDYTVVPGMTNLPMFTGSCDPSAWAGLYMRSDYAGQFDNIEVGTGTIPEPATIALLSLGAINVLNRRKRKVK